MQSISIMGTCMEPWKTKSKSFRKKKNKKTTEAIATPESHIDEIKSVGKNFNNLF